MHGVAIQSNGVVVAWGNPLVTPTNLSNVVAIAAGSNHGIAYEPGRPLIGWGFNYGGALMVPTEHTNFTAIAAGQDLSVAITLQPLIMLEPVSATIAAGRNQTLSVQAVGMTPLTYQWYHGEEQIPSATNSTLTLINLQAPDQGDYHAMVSNAGGSVNSLTATVTVIASRPRILTHPASQTVAAGNAGVFRVNATGSAPLYFQWRFNGTNMAGATNDSYVIPAVTENQAGSYSVVVTNSMGTATSTAANLRVIVPPQLGLRVVAGDAMLSLTGIRGSNYTVHYSIQPGTTNWMSLRSITNLPVNPYQFLDAAGSTSPARFYRAVMQ